MFLLFLLIQIFFIPISCLLYCTGGPNCHIKLDFNQIIPSNKELLKTCSIINASSCSVYLKVDYKDQHVDISFDKASNDTKSPHPAVDLLTTNPEASIILRYTVKVRIYTNNEIQLHVLLQCRTVDQCAEKQLRHFWPRFISLNRREGFYKLLYPITSNVIDCFDDQTNQFEQCSILDHICWASTDTQRKCTIYDNNHCNDFIYSYNSVERPHRLTHEDVYYTLACRVNDCNTNESIHRVRRKFFMYSSQVLSIA
jgi:hypothetical protein